MLGVELGYLGTSNNIKESLDVPRIGWPTDLTFDTKRKRLVLLARGILYAYEPATAKWSALAEGLSATAITYSAKDDALYVIRAEHERVPSLVKLNSEAAVVKTTPLSGPIVPGMLPDGPGVTGVQLVAVEGHLVLFVPPFGRRSSEVEAPQRECIYLIDSKSGKSQLTYKNPPGAWAEKGLAFERTFAIKAGEVRAFPITGSPKDQRLTVSVRSEGAPIDAYLLAREDAGKAEAAIGGGKLPEGFVASARGVEEASFTVVLKAGKGFSLLVGARKAAVVSVAMTDQ